VPGRISVLQSYLPVIVFVGLGIIVGGAFIIVIRVLGPSRPKRV
jgi:NADH:ubiquinone oxidoreductase subunit 3 (subunit A)